MSTTSAKNLGTRSPTTSVSNLGTSRALGLDKGAWVGNRWHDPLDPHPVPARERQSGEAFD